MSAEPLAAVTFDFWETLVRDSPDNLTRARTRRITSLGTVLERAGRAHPLPALEEAGHTPIVLDSLLTGPRMFVGDRVFYEGDISDRALLARSGFGAIEAEGSHRSWWSIRYDDAVPKLLATPDYKVAQILGG